MTLAESGCPPPAGAPQFVGFVHVPDEMTVSAPNRYRPMDLQAVAAVSALSAPAPALGQGGSPSGPICAPPPPPLANQIQTSSVLRIYGCRVSILTFGSCFLGRSAQARAPGVSKRPDWRRF